MEPTPVGVAMTLSWSLDIERRGHDRHLRSLDADLAIAHVRAFVDEYLAALGHR
jgi:hypothetical protein